MKRAKLYLLPVCFSASFFVALIVMGRSSPNRTLAPRSETSSESEVVALPHGRVLYLIVEESGVFVGDVRVPFSAFESFLLSHRMEFRADFVKVLGADLARYGQAVEVYTTVRNVLKVPATIDTVPVPIGTRRGPIEVHAHHWEY